jgi:S-methylmethionine-dependent homocysteine/selenocysteine methylase
MNDNHNRFLELFSKSERLLTEGALVERLKHEYGLQMDPAINHAGLIYHEHGKTILADIYKQYIALSVQYQIPMMLMTPTRRVNADSLKRSVFKEKNIIEDSVAFLNELKSQYPLYCENILVGGLLGCKGDAYDAGTALDTGAAYHFHKIQVDQFSSKEIDFLFAGIMPAKTEALGMALAMAGSGIPYIISFMVNKDGRLLDGTPLADAIRTLDESVSIKPVCYMANCIHPYNLNLALSHPFNRDSPCLKRIMGIQANTSLLEPWELDQCETLDKGDYGFMISEIGKLKENFGFKILGGCCGTDAAFIDQLARSITRMHTDQDPQA